MTCSGADCAVGGDEAERLGVELPPLGADTVERLRALLPSAATVANPLDYTALVWGETATLRDMIATLGADDAIDQVLVLYDQPAGVDGWSAQSWANVRDGIVAGAAATATPVLVAATLPELLDDASATDFAARGIPASCGMREGMLCALALQPWAHGARGAAAGDRGGRGGRPGRGRRLRRRALARRARGEGAAARPRRSGRAGPRGARRGRRARRRRARGLARRPQALGRRRCATRPRPGRSRSGSPTRSTLRREYRRLAAGGGAVLVEAMAAGAVELIVAARRDAVVPALVIGMGGVWAELLDDAAVVPLPATPARVAAAIRVAARRAAPVRRPRPGALDVDGAAELAAQAGDALLAEGLELLELNPVLVSPHGALALDAVAREGPTRTEVAA